MRDTLYIAVFAGGMLLLARRFEYSTSQHEYTLPHIANRIPASQVACIVALCAFRFWLTMDRDIIAMPTMSESYVNHSLSPMTRLSVHPPALSVLATLSAELGIPWRLFTELLFQGACVYCGLTLYALYGSSLLSVLITAVLLLHTHGRDLSTLFIAEGVLISIHVFVFTNILQIVATDNPRYLRNKFQILSILLVLWDQLRPEQPLIFCLLILLACSQISCYLLRRKPRPAAILALYCLPIISVLGASQCVKLLNQYSFGVYATDQMHSPSLSALMSALYRIKAPEALLHAPVTRSSLKSCCDISPTMQSFRDGLLDENHPEVRNGEPKVGKRGEAGPHLFWLLSREFTKLGTRAGEVCMHAAAEEVLQAAESGTVQVRLARFPINPYTAMWTKSFFETFPVLLTVPINQSSMPTPAFVANVTESLATRFDIALTRRAISTTRRKLELRRTISNRDDQNTASNLVLRAIDGATLATFRVQPNNPAILDAIDLPVDERRYILSSAESVSGKECVLATIEKRLDRNGLHLVVSETSEDFNRMYDARIIPERDGIKESLRSSLDKLQTWWSAVPLLACFGGLIACRRTHNPWLISSLIGCVILFVYWVGRAIFYSLIFAWLGWGPDRYMDATAPVTILLAGLASYSLPVVLIRTFQTSRQFDSVAEY